MHGKKPLGSCRAEDQIGRKKTFSIISRLEMVLSIVSYARKNIVFHTKNFKLTYIVTYFHEWI